MGLLPKFEDFQNNLLINPFTDQRQDIYREFIYEIKEFNDSCNDILFWKFESYPNREKLHDELKRNRKKIYGLLGTLIPKLERQPTHKRLKGKHVLKVIKYQPAYLVIHVEYYKYVLRKYLKPRYKVYEKKIHDIRKACDQELNINTDNLTKIKNDKSKRNIAISLISYQTKIGYRTLDDIYKKVKPKEREQIINNLDKYI